MVRIHVVEVRTIVKASPKQFKSTVVTIRGPFLKQFEGDGASSCGAVDETYSSWLIVGI
jgi:hypothetical protein